MARHADTQALIRTLLAEDFLTLQVEHAHVDEHPGPARDCRLSLTLRPPVHGDAPLVVQGHGVGFVDATYRALVDHFADEFRSLTALVFTGFLVRAKMETGTRSPGLDAEVEVTVQVRTRHGRDFWFSATDRSTLNAGISAVVQVVEHFVNAERAYLLLHKALADATRRDRGDLVDAFRSQMAQLVTCGQYEGLARRARGG
ncbi:MAG: hypothetical protein H6702_22550 [Myxococcales bacterium]|nr:hypothetical protein [Myxococcales bacterium]